MSQSCPKCSASCRPEARFCSGCGFTLGATLVHNRTVVAPTTTTGAARLQFDVKALVQKTQTALGNTVAIPASFNAQRASQREHTFFVTDVSGSMGGDYDGTCIKLEAAKWAQIQMILEKEQIDPQDYIGLISFNSAAYLNLSLSPLISHKPTILKTVQGLVVQGGTDINEGLKLARDSFDWSQQQVVRRIVLLTDGQGGHPLSTADDLKGRGVVIDVIGVGPSPSGVDEKLLRKVASTIQGENRYRFIKDQATLVKHYTHLANKTATR